MTGSWGAWAAHDVDHDSLWSLAMSSLHGLGDVDAAVLDRAASLSALHTSSDSSKREGAGVWSSAGAPPMLVEVPTGRRGVACGLPGLDRSWWLKGDLDAEDKEGKTASESDDATLAGGERSVEGDGGHRARLEREASEPATRAGLCASGAWVVK